MLLTWLMALVFGSPRLMAMAVTLGTASIALAQPAHVQRGLT